MNLLEISKPKPKPPMITLVATPGVGKTTLAGLFPNPIFIQAEYAGTVFESSDCAPDMFPVIPRPNARGGISSQKAIMDQITHLGTTEHDYKTLVIDTCTTLNGLLEAEVTQNYGVDNVADAAGGYHKGYLVVAQMHQRIVAACDRLREVKGIAVVFLAHCGIQKMKNRPDADEYTVFTLDMHKESIQPYVNLVDAVLYMRNQEFVMGVKKDKKDNVTRSGKVSQTGQRQIVTCGDGQQGFINAKNRYGLPPVIDVELDENPLLDLIPFFKKVSANETIQNS